MSIYFRVKLSEALRQVKKQHFKVKFWNWGPSTIWPIMTCFQFFPLKNHSTLLHIVHTTDANHERKCCPQLFIQDIELRTKYKLK